MCVCVRAIRGIGDGGAYGYVLRPCLYLRSSRVCVCAVRAHIECLYYMHTPNESLNILATVRDHAYRRLFER